MDRTNINRSQGSGNSSGKPEKQNNLTLINRETLSITGVEDIVSFDETNIIMKTTLGVMTVDGADLHIVKLNVDSGDVVVEGTVSAVFYLDQNGNSTKKNTGSLFRRK